MKIKDFDISLHTFEHFRLDGGAMFGSVPKNLWSKLIPADEQNRITLATNCLVLTGQNKKILVDVGNGNKWDEKLRNIFAIESLPSSSLVAPESITHVILTHLHFDHAGGISYYDNNHQLKLTYPNAEIFVQRRNYENALNPGLKERASYLKENVEILKQSKLNLLDGKTEIFPGLFVHSVDGHTIGQQYMEISGNEGTILFATDLIPTSHHLPLPYHMGYDICGTTLIKEKEVFLEYALNKNAIVVFEHDISIKAARIEKNDKGHYCVREKIHIS
jgi:glyoxylase-like metal-dependent hydrolase (beta-lactamase superfamily II)